MGCHIIPFCTNDRHAIAWSPYKFGPGKCILCDPPKTLNPHRVGLITPSGGILLPSEVTTEIAAMNRLAVARKFAAGRNLTPTNLSLVTLPTIVIEDTGIIGSWYKSNPSPLPPPAVVAKPGEGFWRDQDLIDASIEEFNRWTVDNQPEKNKSEVDKTKKYTRKRKSLPRRTASIDISEGNSFANGED